FSHDLISKINEKFSKSFSIKVCALESEKQNYLYPSEVTTILNTRDNNDYANLSHTINNDQSIQIVVIQHEFGFFHHQKTAFTDLLTTITKPIVIVFHTVLPKPDNILKAEVNSIAANVSSIVVMTRHSADILVKEYGIHEHLITVIPHGTHLVAHVAEKTLKKKHGLTDRKVLSTFGLLSSGKSIETTLEALPAIISECPEVVFLVMGMTHPEVRKNDGEIYREMLEKKVKDSGIEEHVMFINRYLPLPELLEYLQLTDIYLFTTNDPNQAVSGTFAYAASCACPIISTPIPHALEVLTKDTGIIIDFHNSEQLAESVIKLLKNDKLRKRISLNTLIKIMDTAWENV
ncbi:MAG: mannosyltransferase, partial [Bacteroidetes bacterium HGW-Bacteroidetes-22]